MFQVIRVTGLAMLLATGFLVPDMARAASSRFAQPKSALIKGKMRAIHSLAFAPDGKMLAVGGEGEAVELWDLATRQRRATLTDHPRGAYAMTFSPDGKTLAVGSYKHVKLWDVLEGKEITALRVIEWVTLGPGER